MNLLLVIPGTAACDSAQYMALSPTNDHSFGIVQQRFLSLQPPREISACERLECPGRVFIFLTFFCNFL